MFKYCHCCVSVITRPSEQFKLRPLFQFFFSSKCLYFFHQQLLSTTNYKICVLTAPVFRISIAPPEVNPKHFASLLYEQVRSYALLYIQYTVLYSCGVVCDFVLIYVTACYRLVNIRDNMQGVGAVSDTSFVRGTATQSVVSAIICLTSMKPSTIRRCNRTVWM